MERFQNRGFLIPVAAFTVLCSFGVISHRFLAQRENTWALHQTAAKAKTSLELELKSEGERLRELAITFSKAGQVPHSAVKVMGPTAPSDPKTFGSQGLTLELPPTGEAVLVQRVQQRTPQGLLVEYQAEEPFETFLRSLHRQSGMDFFLVGPKHIVETTVNWGQVTIQNHEILQKNSSFIPDLLRQALENNLDRDSYRADDNYLESLVRLPISYADPNQNLQMVAVSKISATELPASFRKAYWPLFMIVAAGLSVLLGIVISRFDQKRQLALFSELAESYAREIENILRNLSHQMRNKIAVIQLRADLIREETEKADSPNREYIGSEIARIQEATSSLRKILLDLKPFIRKSSTRESVTASSSAILRQAIGLCEQRFKNHGIEFELSVVQDCDVVVHESQMVSAIVGLFGLIYEVAEPLHLDHVLITQSMIENLCRIGFEIRLKDSDSRSTLSFVHSSPQWTMLQHAFTQEGGDIHVSLEGGNLRMEISLPALNARATHERGRWFSTRLKESA